MKALLSVDNLRTHFFVREGTIKAVDGVSFALDKGQTLGIAGESGSGKSVTSLSILRLIAWPPGKIVGGDVRLEGRSLLSCSNREMRAIRGNEISMIFQDPMTSLNPVFTVGRQIVETLVLHQHLDKASARERTIALLKEVGIPNPSQRIDQYPHEYSGGMRQRAMIAMALACEPKILIADEPTTALDVTIQAQILALMNKLKQDLGTSIVIITHDLGVLAEMADKIVIMYAGKVLECGDTDSIFYRPCHPYTWGLLKSIPRLDQKGRRLVPIEGNPPSMLHLPKGCCFQPRCRHAMELCLREAPALRTVRGGHQAACHLSSAEVEHLRTDLNNGVEKH